MIKIKDIIKKFPFLASGIEDLKKGEELLEQHAPWEEQFLVTMRGISKTMPFLIFVTIILVLFFKISSPFWLWLKEILREFLSWFFGILTIVFLIWCSRTEKTTSNNTVYTTLNFVDWTKIATNAVIPHTINSIDILSENGWFIDNFYYFSWEELLYKDDLDLRVIRIRIEREICKMYDINLATLRRSNPKVVTVTKTGIYILPKNFISNIVS